MQGKILGLRTFGDGIHAEYPCHACRPTQELEQFRILVRVRDRVENRLNVQRTIGRIIGYRNHDEVQCIALPRCDAGAKAGSDECSQQ